MIGNVLAIAVLVMRADPNVDRLDALEPRSANPALAFGPCIDGDESAAVRDLIELELRDAPVRDAAVSIGVVVRCTDSGQEIHVEPWASLGSDGIRAIDLPPANPADPAAREARVRELALAIAELIRRLEITHPLASPPPPPPAPAPPVTIAAAPAPEATRERWRLGLLSSFEHFAGGQSLGGGDLALARSVGPWFWGEVRVGGRVGPEASWPAGHVTARAGTASAAVAWNLCPDCTSVGLAVLARLQGYLVEYRAVSGLVARTAAPLGAVVACAEPQLRIALGRRVFLVASAAVGFPVHGIVLRGQGAELASLSGLVVSGHLGLAVSF